MRVRFLTAVALLLGMVACQQDYEFFTSNKSEVDFQLKVDAVELATRAGQDGEADAQNASDSAYGAIDYLQGTAASDYRVDWSDVDLRYSLEVYDKADNYDGVMPVKDRQVIIVDEYEPVNFDLRLVPNRDYHFVVFADFVPQGATNNPATNVQSDLGLHHKIGANLGYITVVNDKINDECTDAYFATKDVKVVNSATEDIVLKRPYGKLRVVATDLAELNLNVDPATIKVTYTDPHAKYFNAVTGKLSDVLDVVEYESTYNEGVSKNSLENHFYTVGYDAKTSISKSGVERHSHMTLFTDYILATDDQNPIHFTIEVFDKSGKSIKVTEFTTDIPVQRNYLTTVIGNVLTLATDVDVTIDDNFANHYGAKKNLLETLMNGGEFTLTQDMVLSAPTKLTGDAVIDLNGYTLTYLYEEAIKDAAHEDFAAYMVMTRVENGSSLTFRDTKGGGKILSDGYIASANEGGKIYVEGGYYESTAATLFQANGGEVYIYDGYFKAGKNSDYNDYRYTLNHIDSKKSVGLIEVSGGSYYMYDPQNSLSENPVMNFVKDGYCSDFDGVDTYVVGLDVDFVAHDTYMEVYNAKGLLKWTYVVNHVEGKENYGAKIMRNITMPQYTAEVDHTNQTYVFTTTPITVTDGVPSGSNFVPARQYTPAAGVYYGGFVHGNNHTISGLRINSNDNLAAFISWSEYGAEVKDLTFSDAVVYTSKSYAAIVVGYNFNGAKVSNCHVKNSSIKSTSANVGAIVSYNYDKDTDMTTTSIVENCTTDAATTVVSANSNVGGIVGFNYGGVIRNCVNNASVSGYSYVGGITGYTREYTTDMASGYIIGCKNTGKIKGTQSNIGGIVGYSLFDDKNHNNVESIVVACCSTATEVVGSSYYGLLLGREHYGLTYGSWAYKTASVSKVIGYSVYNTQPKACYAFDSAASITEADVDAMNAAIADYNVGKSAGDYNYCPYTWRYVAGGSPVLQ